MGVLEQVIELKGRGIPENEIVAKLKEQGVPPNAITDALNQAKIKKAVSSSGKDVKNEMEPSMMDSAGAEPPPKELPTEGGFSDTDLTPIARQKYQTSPPKEFSRVSQEVLDEEDYVPQPQGENYSDQNQQQYPQNQYSQQEQYIPQEYSPQEYESPVSGISDTDTIIEITEQVFSEKIKTIQKQVEDLNEFKVLAQTKIDNISNRLKRIELNIDRLQAAILEKIGSYGRGLEGIKKEMGMMQQSFGKVVNTLADKTEEKRKHHRLGIAHTTPHKTSITKKKISRPATKKTSKKK